MKNNYCNILNTIKNDKEIIAIYLDTDNPNDFIVGRVISVSDEYFIITLIDNYGKQDGILLHQLDSICMIEKDTIYLNNLSKIMNRNDYEQRFNEDDDLLEQTVKFLESTLTITTIALFSADYEITGRIKKIEDELIYLNQVNKDGYIDGNVIISIHDITYIQWNTKDELYLADIETHE